jgi:hypothetical protein
MPDPNAFEALAAEIEQELEDIITDLIKDAREQTSIADDDTLNRNEQFSIEALVAYIAHAKKLKPESLQSLLELKFGAADIATIKRRDYQKAIKYLVDLQDSGSVN